MEYPGLTVVYATEEPPDQYEKSVFLAGPTPRSQDVQSWRPDALRALAANGYEGVVFVPEDRPVDGITTFHGDYDAQVEWEHRCLNMADCILFWIPRSDDLPGFTTNDEWGVWKNTGKSVLGAPLWANKIRYQIHYASELQVPYAYDLGTAVRAVIEQLGEGALRFGGEREVPLYIWRTASFQNWYKSLRRAGNILNHAQVEWTYRVGPDRNIVFLWALHVEIYVAGEDRNKINEVVISRADISSVVLYHKKDILEDSEVALVREFRSTVNNWTGYVWENPGGSSFKEGVSPEQLASDEVFEETGLQLTPERFQFHQARQLNATLSAHRAYVFSVELTEEEMAVLKDTRGTTHGVSSDSERTFVEVLSLKEILDMPFVDWSAIGMIMRVLR